MIPIFPQTGCMTRPERRIGPGILFALLSCCALSIIAVQPSRAWGAEPSLQEKIEKEKQNLEQLKQEIRKTRKQRDQSRKKHDAVLQSIERLDRRLHKERREAAAVNRDIEQIDRELKKIGAQLTDIRMHMHDQEAVIGTHLRWLYMEGRVSWVHRLMAVDASQCPHCSQYLSSFVMWEDNLLENYKREVEQRERLLVQRAKARESLVGRKQQIDKQMGRIRGIKSEKREVLASLKKTTQSHEQKLRIYDRTENRKETLLKELERQSQGAGGKTRTRTPDVFRRGTLLWPAAGDVVGFFGRQKHRTFDTYVQKKGIEIAASEGSAIWAVSGGDVVYADWLSGYGLVVILDHGNNYFTFYAHASRLEVKEGETVAKGAVLGKTGSSGLTNKTVLYFELRKGTRPVNPLKWLAKR